MNHLFRDFEAALDYLWCGGYVQNKLFFITNIALRFTLALAIHLFGNVAEAKTYQPCPTDRPDYFCISPDMTPNSPIDIVKFYTTPTQILQLFQTELEQKPYPIILNAEWESPFFGAGVSFYENNFRLMILGGTTRIAGLTPDAYAAIVCHELGHVIGGSPFQTITLAEWASAEGQSDFFAANVCLPRYFRSLNESEDKIPTRIEQAGYTMIQSFYQIIKDDNAPIRFKADTTKTNLTLINNYPTLQCRYENFRNLGIRPECWYRKSF
jgi:hypothetical protein